jgi:hypothetical protein
MFFWIAEIYNEKTHPVNAIDRGGFISVLHYKNPIKETVNQEVRTLEINEDLEDVATPLDLEISLGAGELFISKTSGEMPTGTIHTTFDAPK